MIKLLLENCTLPIDTPAEREFRVSVAIQAGLGAAVKANRIDVAQLIVKKLGPGDYALTSAVKESIQHEQEEMATFLLGVLPQEVPSFFATGKPTPRMSTGYIQTIINDAFDFAAGHGHLSMIRLLAERISCRIDDSLIRAVEHNHVAVIKVLLELCEENDVKRCEIYRGIEAALSIAASAQNTEMVELLTNKTRYDNRLALMKAVKAGDLKATNTLVEQNNQSAIAAALFEAPTSCPAILEVLVEHIDQKTIQQALTQSDWKTKVLRLLLEKCDPGAYAAVFLEVATQCRAALMELMLGKVDSCTLTRALARAVFCGHSEVVKLLMDVCDSSSLSFAMETAALTGQSALVELLRGMCDARSERHAAAKAQAAGCDDVVQMLESKRARMK